MPLLTCSYVVSRITWDCHVGLLAVNQPSQPAGQIEHKRPEHAIFKFPLAKYEIISTEIYILNNKQTYIHFTVANIVSAHAFAVSS